MNNYLERLLVESSNKCNELGAEIEDLKEQVEYQDQWRKEYLERIDKAIEYIENCNYGTEEYKIYEIATDSVDELLNILKGEDNDK